MKTGVVYPQTELGGDAGAVKAFAQAAEDLGYDHIVIYDHVLGAVHADREPKLTGPYKENDPFHEPLITYAYLAGVTQKLELVTGVIILPQNQITLIRKLWEQPVVEHEDADHRIARAGILPRPKRQIPIWLGGFSEAA